MSSPIHRLSVGLVILLALWAGCIDGIQGAQDVLSAGTLRKLTVDGTSDRIVVTLIADRPLDGVLERIAASPARVFVDLKNVVPEVDRVTDVSRGSVTRVRVGLNQADPPVTRVVLDLEGATSSFLEQGATERELRITVVAESSVTSARTPRDPVGPTDQYEAWFAKTTGMMSKLLARDARMQPGAANGLDQLDRLALEWSTVRRELDIVRPPPPFEAAHELLVTAGALGHVVITSRRDGSLPVMHAWAANAGAAMLVRRAQALTDPPQPTRRPRH